MRRKTRPRTDQSIFVPLSGRRWICPKCSREMRIIALIDDREVIERILRHLGLREEGVRVPAFPASFRHTPFIQTPFFLHTPSQTRRRAKSDFLLVVLKCNHYDFHGECDLLQHFRQEVKPPSITRSWPMTKLAAGEVRNTTDSTISRGP